MRTRRFLLVLICILLLAACGNQPKPGDHLADIYTVALDTIMKKEMHLNKGIKFIAIDRERLYDLNKDGRQQVIDRLQKKYDMEVFEATFKNLKDRGYNPETKAWNGVLLEIEDVEYTYQDDVIVTGSKYRTGIGSCDLEMKISYEEDKWVIDSSVLTRENQS